MASELKPLLNGETGKVTHLARHQGKMSTKSYEICFVRNVIAMPNSEPVPDTLHSCMKIGTILYYNAKLTIDPVSMLPTYVALKVWFPNTKVKGGQEPPPRVSPLLPDPVTAKMLRRYIVKLLKERGSLTPEQLHSELGPLGAEWCTIYDNTPKGLLYFISYNKAYFVFDDGHVRLLEDGGSLVKRSIQVIKGLLQPLGSASQHQLFEKLQDCDQDVRNLIFSSNALYSFLVTHPDDFVILPDGTIFPIERGDDKLDSEDPRIAIVMRNVACLLRDKERMPLDVLFKELKEALPEAVHVVGNKPKDLQKLLIGSPSMFVVHANQMVQLIKPAEAGNGDGGSQKGGNVPKNLQRANKKKKKSNASEQNSLPRHFRGPIQSIGAQFGFIRHGSRLADNIFFDSESYMEPVKDLKSALVKGDVMDCLFNETPGKRNKYRAVAVWKVAGVDAAKHAATSELLVLPAVLSSPVYFGEAEVTYVAGELGYCCLRGRDTDSDSLIEFEEYEKSEQALITFHLGHMRGHHELPTKIKKGMRVIFLANYCKAGTDSMYPVHGNAIGMWPSTERPAAATDSLSVTAEVQELTSEGGRLTFGNIPWEHGITFYWKQIVSSTHGLMNKVVQASVGDTFWCIVTSGEMTKDPTKWVAVELFPYNSDMTSSPPPRYLSCPAMPLPRRGMADPEANPKDPGNVKPRSSSFGSNLDRQEVKKSDWESGETSERRKPKPKANPPQQSHVNNSADLLLDLGTPFVGSDAPDGGAVNPETDVPKIVDGIGKMVSKDNYGGILETDGGDVLPFTAHAFFYQGRPVSHLAFPVGTQVHFDGQYTETGEMFAPTIWIGKRPLQGRSTSFPQ